MLTSVPLAVGGSRQVHVLGLDLPEQEDREADWRREAQAEQVRRAKVRDEASRARLDELEARLREHRSRD